IIGTFFFLGLLGYSINLLTLFALVLAIGIVVDDAIVVVEAVHSKIDEGETDVKKATVEAMSEISGAIVSITLVLAAVFIPVTFVTGPTGVFYEQFGVTLIIAILISAVNALTLSPALCALFLKGHDEKEGGKKKNFVQRFFDAFNRGFRATVDKYGKSVHFLYRHKWITAVVLLLAVGAIFWSASVVKTGFVPNEDQGIIFMNIELPPGSSIDRTQAVNDKLYAATSKIPGVLGVSIVAGRSILNGGGSNYGLGFARLDDWGERGEDSLSLESITAKMFAAAAQIPEANIIFFARPSVPGFGNSAGVEVNLLDRASGSFEDLNTVNQEFMGKLTQRPEFQFAQSSFNTNYPQYELEVNVPLAKDKGVSVTDIFSTLQGYIGSIFATDFSRFGKQFRVYVQALPEDRTDESSLNGLFVRTQSGEMTPITEFISLKRVYGPQSVTRFNLFNSTKITAAVNPGFSTGDGIAAVNEVAKSLPNNYTTAYSGLSREEVNAGNQSTTIFILSLVFVYFLLAAQYESYLVPFSILFSLPLGVMGAYLTTQFTGLQNNIYFQIALIMLLGLLAKNAILIVEFALQRRRQGETILDAAIEGAESRLRPILMTSFAFILGILPLALASGVGAAGNRSIGTGAVGGLLIGTVFGVFVIPILFILFQWLQEKITGDPSQKKIENTEQNA
ncbi:MAG: efflux RND transporter permease subunit, partial [Pricia sp.]